MDTLLKNYILEQTTQRKIELLEDAYDEGIGVFIEVSKILLTASCGEGGGLPTEVIDRVFQKKLNKL